MAVRAFDTCAKLRIFRMGTAANQKAARTKGLQKVKWYFLAPTKLSFRVVIQNLMFLKLRE